MTTKVTIIGEQPEEKQGKKIEFVKYVEPNMECITPTGTEPNEFVKIDVKLRESGDRFDTFFCYNIHGTRYTYLGHFNDGIV